MQRSTIQTSARAMVSPSNYLQQTKSRRFFRFSEQDKVVMTDAQIAQEMALQNRLRRDRVCVRSARLQGPLQLHISMTI